MREDGELMFNQVAKQDNGATDGKGPAFVAQSHVETSAAESAAPPRLRIPYVLVSIMNNLYLQQSSVQAMMEGVAQKYPDSAVPTIYVCGDAIYEATKSALFGDHWQVDPIEKNRNKWLKQYNFSKTKDCATFSWEIFYGIPEYKIFRKFTDAVMDVNLSAETLRVRFPDANSELLELLLSAINASEILTHIPEIAGNFSQKNLDKLAKQATKAINQQKELQQRLGMPPSGSHSKVTVLEKRKEELEVATYKYLADEYAAFLLLAYFQSTSDIQTHFGISCGSKGVEFVQPELLYPMDATRGARLIFNTFRLLEQLYIDYSESLGLLRSSVKAVINNIEIAPQADSSPGSSTPSSSRSPNGSPVGGASAGDGGGRRDLSGCQAGFLFPSISEFDREDLDAIAEEIMDVVQDSVASPMVKALNFIVQDKLQCQLTIDQVMPKNTTNKGEEDLIKARIIKVIQKARFGIVKEIKFDYQDCLFTVRVSPCSAEASSTFNLPKKSMTLI